MKLFKKNRDLKKEILSFLDRDKEKIMITAMRDWRVLVGTTIALCVIFIGISFLFFIYVKAGETPSLAEDELLLSQVVTKEQLQEVLSIYEQRDADLASLRENPPTIIDPSR